MMHLLFLLLFSAAVGIVVGAMLRSEVREIALVAVWVTGALTVVALAISWLLYFLPPGTP